MDSLIELIINGGNTENHNSNIDEEAEICQLTASLIGEGLNFCKSTVNRLLKIDPNMELKSERDIKNCIVGIKS